MVTEGYFGKGSYSEHIQGPNFTSSSNKNVHLLNLSSDIDISISIMKHS
jgi:hypothetical protein